MQRHLFSPVYFRLQCRFLIRWKREGRPPELKEAVGELWHILIGSKNTLKGCWKQDFCQDLARIHKLKDPAFAASWLMLGRKQLPVLTSYCEFCICHLQYFLYLKEQLSSACMAKFPMISLWAQHSSHPLILCCWVFFTSFHAVRLRWSSPHSCSFLVSFFDTGNSR